MNITYIGHSGFGVELDNQVLLLDYYQGQLPRWPKDKTIRVFSSHAHHDHFTFQLFDLLKVYPKVEYIFSWDIRKQFSPAFVQRQGVSPELWQAIHFMKPDEKLELPGLTVETLRSTDQGVAFLIEAEGHSLYHAGDLHLWTWRGEPEEDNRQMAAAFYREMEKLRGRHFEEAFAVLDPRQEEDFWQGLDYLMRHVEIDRVWPMHFWGDISVIPRLLELPCSEPYRHKVAAPEQYGSGKMG